LNFFANRHFLETRLKAWLVDALELPKVIYIAWLRTWDHRGCSPCGSL